MTRHLLPSFGFGTGQLNGETARRAIEEALCVGYRLIDTASRYGNEIEVGRAIAASGVKREEIFVVTKGAHDEDEHGYDVVAPALASSLVKLGLSYIDYYLIHWPVNPAKRRETWRAMEDALQSGKVRAIGVSNYAKHHLQELNDAHVKPAINQIEFHPYIFDEQRDILAYCKEQEIQVMGYATHANGQADHDPLVGQIAERHRKTPRQILTRWSIQHGVISLVRSSDPAHIAQNRMVEDFELSREEMKLLDVLKGERQFRNPIDLP